jgi:prepilin-type N-terminal cleavage/methylation domain-containing protein
MSARNAGRRAEARGFTLIELLVSMTAGVMVSLAVVSLSREASNSFHEETRIASAEMQLRGAIDRLRADMQRAAYMSTGNIWIDPVIRAVNSPVGSANNVAAIPPAFYNAGHMSLGSLAGVRLFVGGSAAATPVSTINGLNPDAIEIGGYFTNVEELAVGGGTGTTAVQAGGACAGQQINIDVNSSPSIWRLVGMGLVAADAGADGGGNYDTLMNSAFQPVAGSPFIVRVTDSTGKSQYAATCTGAAGTQGAAKWNNGAPQVYIDSSTPIAIAGAGGTNATINPIQIVRWQIEPAVIQDPSPSNSPKYDLTRQYVDATGALIPASKEVIAEYAVDLKFAFTIDNTSDSTGNYAAGGGSPLEVFSFEDASSNGSVGADPTTISVGTNGPQRIRSVRIRLSTRVATPDRSEPLDAGTDYVYRYCTASSGDASANCTAGNPVFARTRTLISEVSLPNQARFWYR